MIAGSYFRGTRALLDNEGALAIRLGFELIWGICTKKGPLCYLNAIARLDQREKRRLGRVHLVRFLGVCLVCARSHWLAQMQSCAVAAIRQCQFIIMRLMVQRPKWTEVRNASEIR